MTVNELAALVGMTPRNIRAYQSRGLLPRPGIKGRVAYYTGAHAARLELIASLQREGFTLAAIKRLIETPASYAAIVADRRRRFREGDSDISPVVPLDEELARAALPDLPDDLPSTGLAWRVGDELMAPTILVGISRMLAGRGVPVELLAELQLETARVAGGLGRRWITAMAPGGEERTAQQREAVSDLSKIAVQLGAAAFEIAFLEAALGTGTWAR